MKQSKQRIVLFPAVLSALSIIFMSFFGCNQLNRGHGNNLFRIPWADSSGHYSLQNISIKTFDRPESLQGRFVNILVDPYLINGHLDSANPIGHFLQNDDGVKVPVDFASLQAAAVHAHFERLAELNSEVGIQIHWPLRVGIQANLNDRNGALRNNAIYDGKLDALLIVPYSEKNIPIAINGGILAHEHFHKIFQSLVLKQLGGQQRLQLGKQKDVNQLFAQPCDWRSHAVGENAEGRAIRATGEEQIRLYNSFLLRSMNEGLADFWGWLYSGDANFISSSLPSEKDRRSLSGQKVLHMPGKSKISSWITGIDGKTLPENQLIANAYFVGTAYARIFYELSGAVIGEKEPNEQGKKIIARALIRALPGFLKTIRSNIQEGAMISPYTILTMVLRELSAVPNLKADQKPELSNLPCHLVKRVSADDVDSEVSDLQCDKPEVKPELKPSPTASPTAQQEVKE